MEQSTVRRAAEEYNNGNYSAALQLYQQAASRLGEKYFKLNISLCKQKLARSQNRAAIENPSETELKVNSAQPEITLVERLTSSPSLYFPETNNKLKSYIAEAVIQSKGDLASLGRFYDTNHVSLEAFIKGLIEGIQLRSIIDKRLVILIAGHDLRFVQPFIDYFNRYFEVLIDHWAATNKHDPKKSTELLKKADLIWCEWCAGNAVWYSKNVGKHQKLVVRLHKFEIETAYPSQVTWDNVQSLTFIAEGMRDFANEKHKITCKQYLLYNGFDVDRVEQAYKGERNLYALAMMGFVPYIKRLDKGIDFFERALATNKRFSFHVKGKAAEELPWVWQKEQDFFEKQYVRINALRAAGACVTQELYDDKAHAWLGQKGFVLSASDIEGSHQAVAEAMACGTVPLIFGDWTDRYQARLLYPSELCFKNMDAALVFMNRLIVNPDQYKEVSDRCRAFAHENFNKNTILHGALLIIDGKVPQLPYIPIPKPKRIVIFTDLCINVIDGSSVWMMSLVELLLLDPNIEVILVSCEACKNQKILSKFDQTGRFHFEVFHQDFNEGKIDAYIDFLAEVIKKYNAFKTIVRAVPNVANRMTARLTAPLINTLVYYLIGEAYPDELFLKATSAVLVQTEESKRRFEDKFPQWASEKQVRILRPMIPNDFKPNIIAPRSSLTIAYTGKLSKGYMAKEMATYMINAPANVSFVVCAAKYQRSDGEDYVKRVRSSLKKAVQAGRTLVMESLSREEVINVVSQAHVGWSVRSDIYKASSEISTKVLEYCSLGKPVLLNKFSSNIALLGDDYPLYVDDVQHIDSVLKTLESDIKTYGAIAEHCVSAAAKYKLKEIYNDIVDVLVAN